MENLSNFKRKSKDPLSFLKSSAMSQSYENKRVFAGHPLVKLYQEVVFRSYHLNITLVIVKWGSLPDWPTLS